jgi:hypothetical protein
MAMQAMLSCNYKVNFLTAKGTRTRGIDAMTLLSRKSLRWTTTLLLDFKILARTCIFPEIPFASCLQFAVALRKFFCTSLFAGAGSGFWTELAGDLKCELLIGRCYDLLAFDWFVNEEEDFV